LEGITEALAQWLGNIRGSDGDHIQERRL